MANSRTDWVLPALLGLLGSAGVLAENPSTAEDKVPLYSTQDAWRLAHRPESRMVDELTCERIAGVYRIDSEGERQLVVGARSALFRKNKSRTPFMRVETRSDGVYVARFDALPDEIIVARVYITDPRTKRYIYGEPMESVCRKGAVSVGDVEFLPEEQSETDDSSMHIPVDADYDGAFYRVNV